MSEQLMTMRIPNEDVLDTLSSGFFATVNDLMEIAVTVNATEDVVNESFVPVGPAIGQIDFVGSVVGFVAVSASESFFAQSFDIDQSDELGGINKRLSVPLKEILNTVAGKCLKILLKEFTIVTMLAPKVTFGEIYYPKVKCYTKIVKTSAGDIGFHLSVDQMKIDVARLADKLEETERKSQQVMEYLHLLFGNLEKTQTHIMTEVSLTINNIRVIEDILSKDSGGSAEISNDLAEALSAISNVKELVIRKLSDTIYDLKRFKNMLLNYMLINKQYNKENQLEVMLAGTLTERCDLTFFDEIKTGLLIVDAKSLLNFTQKGIARWIHALALVNQNVEVHFTKCSMEFLKVANQYEGFINRGRITSLSAIYHCADCHHRKAVEIKLDGEKLRDEKKGEILLPDIYCGCRIEMKVEGKQKELISNYLDKIGS